MLLNIDFAKLLVPEFIGLTSTAPQWLLLIPHVTVLHLCKIGRRSFALVVPVEGFQVDEHVQGIGQDQQQHQGHHQPHQDCWGEEGCTVPGVGKMSFLDVKTLDLQREQEGSG